MGFIRQTKKKKKVLLLLGHPDSDSLAGELIATYESGARESGFLVKKVKLGECHFDPVLRKGYKLIQDLEPDLKLIQEYFQWADHVVIAYPNWWGTMPALLKGMFDRMFLPGFAFRFLKDGSGKWEQLLSGKTARVLITMDMHPLTARLKFGDFSNEIRRAILGFAGIDPVNASYFGPVKQVSSETIEQWKKKVFELGKKGR